MNKIIRIVGAILVVAFVSICMDASSAQETPEKPTVSRQDVVKEWGSKTLTDLVPETAVNNLLDKALKSLDYEEVEFRVAYFWVRDEIFGGHWNEKFYPIIRSFAISTAKNYLHQGDNLKGFYEMCRGKTMAALALVDREHLIRLKLKILSAQMTLSKFRNPKFVEDFRSFSQDLDKATTSLDILAKNLSDHELLQILSNESVIIDDFGNEDHVVYSFQSLPDQSLVGFAGRRALEGGTELIDKYIEVLNLLAEDIQTVEGLTK